MSMMRRLMLPVWLLCLAVIGCDYEVYEITMTPQADGTVNRELVCYRVVENSSASQPATTASSPATAPAAAPEPTRSAVGEEKLQVLEKLYAKRLSEKDAAIQKFAGSFKDRLPNDIGQAGTYTVFASNMGTAYSYLEQFGKDDDLVARMKAVEKASTEVTQLLDGWIASAVPAGEAQDKLRAVLKKDFAVDLHNVATFLMLGYAGMTPQEDGMARAVQYAVAHQYFDPRDIQTLAGLNDPLTGRLTWPAQLVKVISDILVRRAGLDAKHVPAVLADNKKALESLTDYLKTTAQFKAALARYEQDKATGNLAPGTAPPTPLDSIEPILENVINLGDSSRDRVRLLLKTTVEPFATNGTYAPASGVVNWAFDINSDSILAATQPSGTATQPGPMGHDAMPKVCYALWSVADEKFQKAHFGRVALDKGNVMEYCLWHAGLSQADAARWDAMIAKLQPGKLDELKQFHFADEPAGELGDDVSSNRALRIVLMLLPPKSPSASGSSVR